MRRFVRPDKPHDFDRAVRQAAANVQTAITDGVSPVFADAWSGFKPALNDAQGGICGYCEGIVKGLHYGDVEHFRPKAMICELHDDPRYWGVEAHGKPSVVGRCLKPGALERGYWWLAYDWENYLFSCAVCNQRWKGNLFPVTGSRARQPGDTGETALLLSPYDQFDPADHFIYGRLGEIMGKSAQGRATIATCGLDRPSLRLQRQKLATSTHKRFDAITPDLATTELLKILNDLYEEGFSKMAFSGMVQTIFYQRSGHKWAALRDLIAKIRDQ